MSKSISFPILEIVTLLVVLFACVLVIIPGFDDYATSMLFDLGKRNSLSSMDVAVLTDSDREESDFAQTGEDFVANQKSLNLGVESSHFPELKIQTDLDQQPNQQDDHSSETEFQLDQPETLEVPPVDHLAFDANGPAQQQQPEVTFDFTRFEDEPVLSDENSRGTQGFPLNDYVATYKFKQQPTSPDLPRIIHQVGNSLQQQPSPTLIRFSEFFEPDSRVVVNSTYSNQDSDLNPISTIDTAQEDISPNDQPYQIRTTARPNTSSPTNANDFVPQR